MEAATTAVKLDVGGTVFTTSLSTLQRQAGTFFEALVRSRGESTAPIFIDRDPTHFRYVLNFLRTGVATAPPGEDARRELCHEAEFYGCDAMIRALHAPPVDFSACLPPEVVAAREAETAIRSVFATNDPAKISAVPETAGLLDFFETYPGGVCFAEEAPCGPASTLLYDALEAKPPLGRKGKAATVPNLTKFKTAFNMMHANILNRLDPLLHQPMMIAGGSVLSALTIADGGANTHCVQTNHSARWGEPGDVDIFVFPTSSQSATRLCKRIWDKLAVDGEFWRMERTAGVVNMARYSHSYAEEPAQVVQVVLRRYASPSEVLLGFDVDCCAVGFSGHRVYCLPRCVRAMQSGQNIVNALHAWPNSPAYELRLTKYATRGYTVVVPGLDMRAVDHGRIRGAEFRHLKGVARLLRIASFIENARPKTFREAKKLLVQHFFKGDALKYNSFGFYHEYEWGPSVRVLPSETPMNSSLSRWSELHSALDDLSPEGATELRSNVPRDIGWQTFVPRSNFEVHENQRPSSEDTRREIWSGIVDVGHEHLDIPRFLHDAWDTTRKQREYLNATDDDCDAAYYAHAYP